MSDVLLIVLYVGFNVILSHMQSTLKYPSLMHLTINKVFSDLLHDHTHTVRGCFHLGLCVLLHLSVLFDCPSTATSTYGLGPNQFLLFSRSLAESTTWKTKRCEITHNAIFTDILLAEYIVADIFFLNASYLWLAIGPSWLIHNTTGFVVTPKGPETKANS